MFPYLDGALRRDLPPVAAAVLADLGIVLDEAAEENEELLQEAAEENEALLQEKKTNVVQVQTQILSDFETLCAEMKTPEKITWCTTTQLFDGAHSASSMCHGRRGPRMNTSMTRTNKPRACTWPLWREASRLLRRCCLQAPLLMLLIRYGLIL